MTGHAENNRTGNNWLTAQAFAHRGRHHKTCRPIENSLSAFQAAEAEGQGVELDVLLSKDGRAMVFHDRDMARLTGQAGVIDDFTAEELSRIPLTGSTDTVLPLSVVLSHLSCPVLVEIKGDQRREAQSAAAVLNAIDGYGGPLAIMSFFPEIVQWFQDHAPDVPRGLVATCRADGALPPDCFSEAGQQAQIAALAVDFIAYDIRCLPNRVTEFCRMTHIPVLTWTVRSPTDHEKATRYTDNIIYERRV